MADDNQYAKFIGAKGFEPSTPCTPSRCASQAALRPDEFCGQQPINQLILRAQSLTNYFLIVTPD